MFGVSLFCSLCALLIVNDSIRIVTNHRIDVERTILKHIYIVVDKILKAIVIFTKVHLIVPIRTNMFLFSSHRYSSSPRAWTDYPLRPYCTTAGSAVLLDKLYAELVVIVGTATKLLELHFPTIPPSIRFGEAPLAKSKRNFVSKKEAASIKASSQTLNLDSQCLPQVNSTLQFACIPTRLASGVSGSWDSIARRAFVLRLSVAWISNVAIRYISVANFMKGCRSKEFLVLICLNGTNAFVVSYMP